MPCSFHRARCRGEESRAAALGQGIVEGLVRQAGIDVLTEGLHAVHVVHDAHPELAGIDAGGGVGAHVQHLLQQGRVHVFRPVLAHGAAALDEVLQLFGLGPGIEDATGGVRVVSVHADGARGAEGQAVVAVHAQAFVLDVGVAFLVHAQRTGQTVGKAQAAGDTAVGIHGKLHDDVL